MKKRKIASAWICTAVLCLSTVSGVFSMENGGNAGDATAEALVLDSGEASDSAASGQDLVYVDGEDHLSEQNDSQPENTEEEANSATSEVVFIDDAADVAFSAEELPADGIAEENDALVSESEDLIEDPDGDQAMELVSKEIKESSYGPLRSPDIVEDSSMKAGQKVTYSCVWFGFYPQSEVGKDLPLYSKLNSLTTGWDDNNDISYNGNRYRRMKLEDATYYRANTSSDSGYYNWNGDADSWHYFLYEPIKWRVLSINGSTALLLADIALDNQNYNYKDTSITWENCTMRSWLNSTFLSCAFTSSQNSAILDSRLENNDNLYYETEGGNSTTDKIFLLSEEDVYVKNDSKSFESQKALSHGFASSYNTSDEARRCKSSMYAKAMGTRSSTSSDYAGNCCWWLRSPGKYTNCATFVYDYGHVSSYGDTVNYNNVSVRPSLNLNLSSNIWTYAGTVCSDGTTDPKGTQPPAWGEIDDTGVGGGTSAPSTPAAPTDISAPSTPAGSETSTPQQPSAEAPTEKITIKTSVSGLKATSDKTSVTATWKAFKTSKKTKTIKKIEVQVSTDKSFSTIVTVKIVGKKKTKTVIKGLGSKTTYYVRARYLDGKGGVSKWSKVKKIKTK